MTQYFNFGEAVEICATTNLALRKTQETNIFCCPLEDHTEDFPWHVDNEFWKLHESRFLRFNSEHLDRAAKLLGPKGFVVVSDAEENYPLTLRSNLRLVALKNLLDTLLMNGLVEPYLKTDTSFIEYKLFSDRQSILKKCPLTLGGVFSAAWDDLDFVVMNTAIVLGGWDRWKPKPKKERKAS